MEHFDLESSLRVSETEIFRCEKCNFNTESKHGLKIHMRIKHTNLEELEYPKIWDFCDSTEYDSERKKSNIKEHMAALPEPQQGTAAGWQNRDFV